MISVVLPSHYTSPPHIYTLSLHDALPISVKNVGSCGESVDERLDLPGRGIYAADHRLSLSEGRSREERHQHLSRSEEHTSELQSRVDLVCRLLLEKKKKKNKII